MVRRKVATLQGVDVPESLRPYSDLWSMDHVAWVKARYKWLREIPPQRIETGQFVHAVDPGGWIRETRYYTRGPGKERGAPAWHPGMNHNHLRWA